MEQCLVIIQFNCHGLPNKLTEFKVFLYTKKPDVVCLCETWLKGGEPRFVGYQCFWSHRQRAPRGGLAILVRCDLAVDSLQINTFQAGQLECLAVKVQSAQGLISIGNFYNPGANISQNEYISYFEQFRFPCILAGDFNAHSPVWDIRGRHNMTGKSLEATVDTLNLGIMNDCSFQTYIDNRTGSTSCLDLFILSPDLLSCSTICREKDLGSDHFPVSCTVGMSMIRASESIPQRWKLYAADWPKYYLTLSQGGPHEQSGPTAEEKCSRLTERIVSAALGAIPRSSGVRHFRFSTPWWDNECAEAVQKRRQAKNRLWRSPSPSNLIEYKRLEARARWLRLQKQRASWEQFVGSLSASTSTKATWAKIRSIQGKTLPYMPTPPLANFLMSDDLGKATAFSHHWFPPGGAPIPSLEMGAADAYQSQHTQLDSQPFTPVELELALQALKNTAPGHDQVMNLFLKKLPSHVKSEILDLFNNCLSTGTVPESWKQGITCPVLKPGKDPTLLASYRPITLLPCIGKLMERLVLRRLEYHLETNNLLQPLSFGFRRGRSTLDALHLLKNDIRRAVEQRQFSVVVFLDLQAAFDSVWHQGLTYKLGKLNISRQLLIWLSTYLEGRTSRVRVGAKLSEPRPVLVGVPQGAVLSPTLFNVMLSDIPTCTVVHLIGYADNLTLVTSAASLQSAQRNMQKYLTEFSAWCTKWCFILNPDKCSYQTYSRCRTSPQIVIRINGRPIAFSQEKRVLGVTFDCPRLNFGAHVSAVRADCQKRLNVLRALSALRWGASSHLLRRVYVAFIRSKLEYGSSVIGELPSPSIKSLECVQNSALRLILGARRTSPILSLQAESFLPPLRLRFRFLLMKWCLRYAYSPIQAMLPGLLGIDPISAKNNTPHPFATHARNLYQSMGIAVPRQVRTPAFSPIPPWISLHNQICLDPSGGLALPHRDSSFSTILAYRMDQFYSGHIPIYTDGSRSEDGSVSAGVFIPLLSAATGWLLSPSHSVMGAELFAIYKALEMALNLVELQHQQVVIFTDSKSSLHLILNTHHPTYAAIVFRIHALLLQRGLNSVAFCWVKGHSGVFGNEVADQIANLAHSSDRSSCSIISFEESYGKLAQAFNGHWRAYWQAQIVATGCGRFRYNLDGSITYIDYSSLARPLQCAVARLRLGHAGVGAHLARFGMAAVGVCPSCQEEDTIAHFILECARFSGPREIFINSVNALGLTWGLQTALGGGVTSKQRPQIFSCLQHYLLACGVVALL